MAKIRITEEEICGLVKQILLEVNTNLKYRDFSNDMAQMGFTRVEAGRGSAEKWQMPSHNIEITVHRCDPVKGDTLRLVTSNLSQAGWFNKRENREKFPYAKWQVALNNYDSTEDEIAEANEQYKDATITPLFQEKDSICNIEYEGKHNICRSVKDRRPLIKDKEGNILWFDECDYDRKTQQRPCLKRENYTTMETEAYPINKDGTIDTENVIIESKKNEKHTIGEAWHPKYRV